MNWLASVPGLMGSDESPSGIEKGDHYQHADGTTEVVYALEDGTVLTLREYANEHSFKRAVGAADYIGVHFGVASLPDVSPSGGPDA